MGNTILVKPDGQVVIVSTQDLAQPLISNFLNTVPKSSAPRLTSISTHPIAKALGSRGLGRISDVHEKAPTVNTTKCQ